MKKTLLVLTILSLLLFVSGYYFFTSIKDAIVSNIVILTLGAIMWILKIIAASALFILAIIIEAIIKGLSGV